MLYNVHDNVENAIFSFYLNVAKKYCHTYSFDEMKKDIQRTYGSIKKIENGLLRRRPSIKRWEGNGFMANTKKWYFLYTIDGDTVYVLDACHAQNMKDHVDEAVSDVLRNHLASYRMRIVEGKRRKMVARFTESDLRGMVMEAVSNLLNEEYEEIGSVDFETEDGNEIKSVMSLRNKGGKQTYHIAKDDGCYVPYAQSLKTGKSKPTYYIFPEMFAALRKLPILPLI